MIFLLFSRFFSRILTVIKKYCWQREVHFGLQKKRGCKSVKAFLSSLFAFWSIALLGFLSTHSFANEQNVCYTSIWKTYDCCLQKTREFKDRWPNKNECRCDEMNRGIEDHDDDGGQYVEAALAEASRILEGCVKDAQDSEGSAATEARQKKAIEAIADNEVAAAKAEARRQAAVAAEKARCISECKGYAAATSQGCPSHSGTLINKCEEICDDPNILSMYNVDDFDGASVSTDAFLYKYREFEKKWNDIRAKCIAEAKETFVDAYAEKCEEKIKKIADEHEKTILCAEEATKQNPQCKEYCKSKADELYEEADISGEFIVNVHMGLPPDANDEDKRRVYQSLIEADMGRVVQREIAQLEIVDNENKLVDPLHWLPCKKGKGQACESNLYRALEEAQDICSDLQNEARECCHEPEQCVGGGLVHALDNLGKLHVTIAGMKGQKKQCEAVQQTFGMYGGTQGAMAAQCMNKASACSQGCNAEVEKVAEAFGKACNHDPRTKANWEEDVHSCDRKLFDHYMKNYKGLTNTERISIGEVSDECKTTGKEANRRIQDMSTHLGTSLVAGMKECGMEPEEWKPPPPPEGCPPNCPPPPPTCPPVCPTPPPPPPPIETTGGGGGGGPSNVADPFADDPLPQAANPFDEDPDLGDGGPDVGKGVQKGMSGLLGGGGGTGGGGLGGLGGGGSSGGGRNRGGGAPAKKTKVLLGFKGGKFTGYGGGSSSGEEKSRGKASRRSKRKRGMASLDMKNLLPKGKQLNHKVGKFGSPHDDIFQRLSDRIQWMCRTDQISCR